MVQGLQFTSIKQLQENAATGDVSKHKVKALCESGQKVFTKANSHKKCGEEEQAYILFWKFVQLCKCIITKQEFKKDEKYFEGMYKIKKNMSEAIVALEALTESLEAKYKKLEEKEANSKEKKKEEAKERLIKENGTENKENLPLKPDEHKITVKELDTLFKQKSSSFFLLDTRPAQDYQRSQIKCPNSINIPEEILSRGGTATSIGRSIHISERSQWERRFTVDKLVLLDWDSKDFGSSPALNALKNALTTYDPDKNYRSPPILLEGGFERFRAAYPHQVTDPKYKLPHTSRVAERRIEPVNLNNIVYPQDLDKGFLVTPSPSPKNLAALSSGAISVSRLQPRIDDNAAEAKQLPEVRYPSLDGIKTTPVFDRRTKPSSRNGSVDDTVNSNLPHDELSDARLSGLSRMDSKSSTMMSTDSTSSLNNAVLGSTNGTTDISSSSFNSTSTSVRTEPGNLSSIQPQTLNPKPTQNIPRVDRSLKPAQVIFSKAISSNTAEELVAAELEITELSVNKQKENMEKELEWIRLCQKREEESDEKMREYLNSKIVSLSAENEELQEREREWEQEQKKLIKDLETLRLQLKEREKSSVERQPRVRFAEEEAVSKMKVKEREEVELRRQLEIMRRDRILKEEARRVKEAEKKRRREEEDRKILQAEERKRLQGEERKRQEEEKKRAEARERRKQEEEQYRKEKLKDDNANSNSELRRSYSSPNLAKVFLDKNKQEEQYRVPVPKFDRKQKPSVIVKRDFAGVWGTTTQPGLTGLRNLGNTCYMNSILQCVSATVPLVNYFVSGDYEEDINRNSETRGQVAEEFSALLASLWNHQYKFISPTNIKAVIGQYKREFSGRDQQDSHEFACKLLEWLHEDTNKIQRPTKMPEIDTTNISEDEACEKFWRSFLSRNQSIIVQLFYGLTKQTTQCQFCGAKSIKFQEFYNLNLFIPNANSRTSLRDCLRNYVKESYIDYTCEKCRKEGKAVQKVDIVRLPPLLIMHLERFYPDEQMLSRSDEVKYRKKQAFVRFPLADMNLDEFVCGNKNRYSTFDLYAVSNHFGSLEGGHYTAFCYSKPSKQWYKYDDQDVSTVDSRSVESSAAYILFFSALNHDSLRPLECG